MLQAAALPIRDLILHCRAPCTAVYTCCIFMWAGIGVNFTPSDFQIRFIQFINGKMSFPTATSTWDLRVKLGSSCIMHLDKQFGI